MKQLQYRKYAHESIESRPLTTIARKAINIAASTILVSAFATQSFAQATSTRFVAFKDFIENTRSAPVTNFVSRAETKVKEPATFEEMRQAILERYKGVEASHSFVLDSQHYDCVPINQQPAFRIYGLRSVAPAPPAELLQHQVVNEAHVARARGIEEDQLFDVFGNSTRCEANTVPLLRTTLETMSNFASLKQYYSKSPDNVAPAILTRRAVTSAITPAVASTHKYATADQEVNNWGGNSNISIYSPGVNRPKGETFSLSQEWYDGGAGLSLQTVEVGWIVYPNMFNSSEQSHFFIFSTPDGYRSGCYNNTCGDFVQVAESGVLGSTFSNYSVLGGTQYEVSAEYRFYQGNWWLGKDGTWIGYYPGTKYGGGQLDQYAEHIEFGTETVGTTIWPPSGSGRFATDGPNYAAYQHNLYYLDLNGNHVWDSLTTFQPSNCYSIWGPFTGTGTWVEYFYEGGPGGTGC